MKETFGLTTTQKQLKNKFDYYKAKHQVHAYLRGKTGNIFNADTNTFNLTDEEWKALNKKFPKAGSSLKTSPLQHYDLCDYLFGKCAASGSIRRPVAERRPSSQNSHIKLVEVEDGSVRRPICVRKRKRDNTSTMYGHQYTQELLQGNNLQCTELIRMSRDSFVRLCNHFKEKNWLRDSKHISVEEKMFIFLMIIGHNERFSVMKRRFQHSKETIHKCFHEVLAQMLVFAEEVIRPTTFNPNSNIPGNNRRERRMFKGAVGALDGTLIHAVVPSHKQNVYRARGRGDCYQNVLAICDFNMIFTYIVAGWEGTAHDARILNEALVDPIFEFPIPPADKYYLCDAAYKHTRGFMAPYRNVRYWLGDFRRKRAMSSKENFNHAHAKLRNVIERAFGVLKACFPILKSMPKFSLVTQRDITISCFAIHNFIRKEGLSDDLFNEYDESDVHDNENVHDDNDGDVEVVQPIGSDADQQYMINLRDQIAAQIMQG